MVTEGFGDIHPRNEYETIVNLIVLSDFLAALLELFRFDCHSLLIVVHSGVKLVY